MIGAVRQRGDYSGLDPVKRSKARIEDADAALRERIGIDRSPAPRKPVGMTKGEWRKVKHDLADQAKLVEIVNPHAQAHGLYERATIVDLGGEHGEGRNRSFQAVLNRGGTAVDRWIANDTTGQFEEPQIAAIRYCRSLWEAAGGRVRAVDYAAERVDSASAGTGAAQTEALHELAAIQKQVPPKYWSVFEMVCRFDEEAGFAGSSIAGNKRSAVDAARTTVALVASLIAMWRRL